MRRDELAVLIRFGIFVLGAAMAVTGIGMHWGAATGLTAGGVILMVAIIAR